MRTALCVTFADPIETLGYAGAPLASGERRLSARGASFLWEKMAVHKLQRVGSLAVFKNPFESFENPFDDRPGAARAGVRRSS